MTLYIDKVFFDEFDQREDLNNEIVEDFYKKFLRKARGVEIIINLSSTNELEELSKQNRLYNDLLEINPSIIINCAWKSMIVNDSKIYLGNPIKMFLLTNADNCEVLEEKYGYLFINNKNLLEKWFPVRWDRDITILTPGNANDELTFDSWQRLEKEKHPFNELMILDLYILEDKSSQRIDHNIIPLIRAFVNNHTNTIKPKVTIITGRILGSPEDKKFQKLDEALDRINKLIPNIDLCIVHYDKNIAPSKNFINEHDREIYTNYLKLECGSGWNIFNNRGDINHRTTVTIQSMLRNDVRNAAAKAWENLSVYRNQIKDGYQVTVPGRYDSNQKLQTEIVQLYAPAGFQSYFLNN